MKRCAFIMFMDLVNGKIIGICVWVFMWSQVCIYLIVVD